MMDEKYSVDSRGKILDSGRYWCIRCQHGSDANSEGYCVDCAGKGRYVRLKDNVKVTIEDIPEEVKVTPKKRKRKAKGSA